MKTVELTTIIQPDRTMTVQLPPDVTPGRHHVVVVIDDGQKAETSSGMADRPAHDVGPWPADLSLRREDMYGDEGR